MKLNSNGIISKLSYSFTANAIGSVISAVMALIVPRFLGVEQYGYWQLYIFYNAYVGLFHFGWCDGVLLRYNGQPFDKLDRPLLSSQFYMLAGFEMVIAAGLALFAIFGVQDSNSRFIMLAIAADLFLLNLRRFFQFLLQGSGRVKAYSLDLIAERVIYAGIVFAALALGARHYQPMICADLISKAITQVSITIMCKGILTRPVGVGKALQEAKANLSVGSKLLFANIANILVIGVIRFAIEQVWDIETFGIISLALMITNIVINLAAALGIVLLPVVKNMAREALAPSYRQIDTMSTVVISCAFLLYFPGRYVLSLWLPQYTQSFIYLAILLPVCLFDGKMYLLIDPYMRALRMEKKLLTAQLTALGVSVILSFGVIWLARNLMLAVVSFVIPVIVRCNMSEYLLARSLGNRLWSTQIIGGVSVVIFVFSAAMIGGVAGAGIYTLWLTILLFLRRNELYTSILNLIESSRKET